MGWTDDQVEKLRQMWLEGLTANEIAKKLGVTKNAIVGKVHRLCLKARPSPIKSKTADPVTPSEETTEENIAVETSIEVVEEVVSVAEEMPVTVESTGSKKQSTSGHVKLTELDSHTCRWPVGDPRDDDFCFCGRKVRTGQTYCDEHSAMAYVKATRTR